MNSSLVLMTSRVRCEVCLVTGVTGECLYGSRRWSSAPTAALRTKGSSTTKLCSTRQLNFRPVNRRRASSTTGNMNRFGITSPASLIYSLIGIVFSHRITSILLHKFLLTTVKYNGSFCMYEEQSCMTPAADGLELELWSIVASI